MKKIISLALAALAVTANANNTYYGFNSQDMADNLVNVTSFGSESASLASRVQFSDFIGESAGYNASNVSYTVAIGDHACEYANNLHRSVAIGAYSLAGRSGRDLTDINGHFYASGLANAFLIDPTRTNNVRTAAVGYNGKSMVLNAKDSITLNAPTGVCINAQSLLWNGNPIGGTYRSDDALVIEDYVRGGTTYERVHPDGCRVTYYYDRWTRQLVDVVLDTEDMMKTFAYSYSVGSERVTMYGDGNDECYVVDPNEFWSHFSFQNDFYEPALNNMTHLTNKVITTTSGVSGRTIIYTTSTEPVFIPRQFDIVATNLWARGGPQVVTLHCKGMTFGGCGKLYNTYTTGCYINFHGCYENESPDRRFPFVDVELNSTLRLSDGKELTFAMSTCTVYGNVYDYASSGGAGYNTNIIQRLRARERAGTDMDSSISASIPASTKYVVERCPRMKYENGFLYLYDDENRKIGKITISAP